MVMHHNWSVRMDCREQMQQKSSRFNRLICQQIVTWENPLTWTLLRWDICSSTWPCSLEGTWKMVLWCSIMKVTSLVASSSSKSISSTEPRTQWENICSIWTRDHDKRWIRNQLPNSGWGDKSGLSTNQKVVSLNPGSSSKLIEVILNPPIVSIGETMMLSVVQTEKDDINSQFTNYTLRYTVH